MNHQSSLFHHAELDGSSSSASNAESAGVGQLGVSPTAKSPGAAADARASLPTGGSGRAPTSAANWRSVYGRATQRASAASAPSSAARARGGEQSSTPAVMSIRRDAAAAGIPPAALIAATRTLAGRAAQQPYASAPQQAAASPGAPATLQAQNGWPTDGGVGPAAQPAQSDRDFDLDASYPTLPLEPVAPLAAGRPASPVFDSHAAWQKLLGEMQLALPAATYYTWLHDTWVEAYEDGDFVIGTRNAYACDWLNNRLRREVRRSLKEIVGRMVDVRFVVRAPRVDDAPNAAPAPLYNQLTDDAPLQATARTEWAATELAVLAERRPRSPALETRLNPLYTFDNFVVGSHNRFACAAAQAIAEKPGFKFNPLFVYGGVGLGKTHLLHAIGNALAQQGYGVFYCTSEHFMNDLISSIRVQNTEAFRNKYRELDVLLIDDIQFIAGKESTQEEFFHTFNHLQASGKQVVLSSDRPPRALSSLEQRLRSRFEGGIQVDVSAPDFETRVAILQSKAIRLGISVPIDVLKLVAERVDSNIRELEGALNHLFLQAHLVQTTLDMALAEHTLNHVSPQRKPCAPPRLIALVAEAYKLTVDDLVGPRRTRPIADARHIPMFLLREEQALSLPQIGQLFGGRDHTTVSHAIEKIGTELRNNETLRRDLAQLREQIYAPFSG